MGGEATDGHGKEGVRGGGRGHILHASGYKD